MSNNMFAVLDATRPLSPTSESEEEAPPPLPVREPTKRKHIPMEPITVKYTPTEWLEMIKRVRDCVLTEAHPKEGKMLKYVYADGGFDTERFTSARLYRNYVELAYTDHNGYACSKKIRWSDEMQRCLPPAEEAPAAHE